MKASPTDRLWQALFTIGELLRGVKPDESDEERRELER
jgi:hypothetical protein